MATIDSYADSNRDYGLPLVASGITVGAGQTFTPGVNGFAGTADLWLADAGGFAGYVLLGITDTVAGVPATALAVSDPVYALPAFIAKQRFVFTGSNQIALATGTVYGLVLILAYMTAGDVYLGMDASSPTHAGAFYYNNGGGWVTVGGLDTIFSLDTPAVATNGMLLSF